MKKAIALLAAVALTASAGTVMAKSIVESKHNLSKNGTGLAAYKSATGTQICIYCHTPHNAKAELPLWNRANPTTYASSGFTLYSGVNMANVSYKSNFTSDSISLFCMSCHDGSPLGGSMIYNIPAVLPVEEKSALNAFTTGLAAESQANISNYVNIKDGVTGKSLKGTHPVNFGVKSGNQPGAEGPGDLAQVLTTVTDGTFMQSENSAVKYPLFKSARSGKYSFECSSCHAVHDDENAGFLRDTMGNSQLCLGCHIK